MPSVPIERVKEMIRRYELRADQQRILVEIACNDPQAKQEALQQLASSLLLLDELRAIEASMDLSISYETMPQHGIGVMQVPRT